MSSQASRFCLTDAASVKFATFRPPEDSRSLWQGEQVFLRRGVTCSEKPGTAAPAPPVTGAVVPAGPADAEAVLDCFEDVTPDCARIKPLTSEVSSNPRFRYI